MEKLNKNFLPSQYNRGIVRKVIKIAYLTNAVLGSILLSMLGVYLVMNNKDKTNLEEHQEQVRVLVEAVQNEKIKLEADEYYQSYMDIKTKQESGDIEVIRDLEFNMSSEMIQNSLNTNLKLNNVEYKDEDTVIISGQALDYLDIQDFYKKLLKQNFIKKLEISSLEVVPNGEGKNYAVKQIVKFEMKGVTKLEELKRD